MCQWQGRWQERETSRAGENQMEATDQGQRIESQPSPERETCNHQHSKVVAKLKAIQARHMSARPPGSLSAEFAIACATEGSAGTSRRGLCRSSRV